VHFLRDPRAHQQHGRLNGNADHRHVPEDAEVKLRVEMKMDVVIILEARHVAPKLEDAVEYTILQRFSRRRGAERDVGEGAAGQGPYLRVRPCLPLFQPPYVLKNMPTQRINETIVNHAMQKGPAFIVGKLQVIGSL